MDERLMLSGCRVEDSLAYFATVELEVVGEAFRHCTRLLLQ